jgi:hypothetical protein
MSNMSYCRFQNTRNDLADCKDALEQMLNADHGPLSREEIQAAQMLCRDAYDILEMLAEYAGVEVEDVYEHIDASLTQANADCEKAQKEEGGE